MLKKASSVFFVLLLTISNCASAYDSDDSSKDSSMSFKLGYHLFPDSDFMDRWTTGADDFNGVVFEIDYDRKVSKNISIGSSLGVFSKKNRYKSVLFTSDSSEIDIKNYYLSFTAKYRLSITNWSRFYIGVGPDFFYTRGDYGYEIGSFHCIGSDSFYTLGLHGLVGFEYIFHKRPQRRGAFSTPISIFIDYKYTWAEIEDADEKLINDINATFGLGLPSNDMNVGGHMLLTGLRWHF